MHYNKTTGKYESDLCSTDFVVIKSSESDVNSESNILDLEIYKDGEKITTETIDADLEGIKDTVSIYFPYDQEAENAYSEKFPEPGDLGPGDPPPPTNACNIDYEFETDQAEEIACENFNEFPECDVPFPFLTEEDEEE